MSRWKSSAHRAVAQRRSRSMSTAGRGRREMSEAIFREEADNVAYVDHEARVFHDVVLGGPAQLRKILGALAAERTRIDTCSEVRVLGVRGSRYTRVHVHQQRRGGRTRCRPCCSCSTSSYLISAATSTTLKHLGFSHGLTIGQGEHGHTARASDTHKCSQPFLYPLNYVVWLNRCQSCLAKDPIQLTRIHTKYSLIPNNIS